MKILQLKKLAVILLALAMLFSIVACNKKGTGEGNESVPGETIGGNNESDNDSGSSDDSYLDIIKDGTCVNIVYAAGSSSKIIGLARSISDGIGRIAGVTAEYSYDMVYDANKVEIVVGEIRSYPETAELMAEVGYGEGIAKVMGNKLVIVGADLDAIEAVINTVLSKFRGTIDENGNLSIGNGFEVRKTSNPIIAELPILSTYTPEVIDTNDDCYMLKFGTNKTTFDKYLNLIEKSDFTLYAKKTIDENEYRTYYNDTIVITSIYTKYNGVCKILVEWLADTELPIKAADNKYTPVSGVTSSITQIGLWYATETTPLISRVDGHDYYNFFNGMNYVIRLDDGSFIVVDSGHANPVQSENLYNILKEQAPDPDNIVIAAWFLSHDHNDHTSMLPIFLQAYKKDVSIERFIYNFPGEAQGNKGTQTLHSKIKSNIKGFFPDAKIIKAHPGQEFNIRNAKITILYTMDVFEKELTDTNNASIVWKMELEDKTFMCLGDYSDSGDTLMKLYSNNTLKSDIVQVAHHGISGSNNNLYVKIAPEYAFWPVANEVLDWVGLGKDPINITDTWEGTMNKYILDMPDSKVFWARDNVSIINIDDGSITTEVFENVSEYLKAN